MNIIKRSADERKELMHGIFKTDKVRTDFLEVIELEIVTGSALKPHDMPCRVAFYVLEGTGTFVYGDRIETLNAGDMLEVSPGVLRHWSNDSDHILRVLVIKSLKEK